jgi:hypothetical protein
MVRQVCWVLQFDRLQTLSPNNRESPEYFENQLKWAKRNIEFWRERGNVEQADQYRRNFEHIFPEYGNGHCNN